MKMDLTYQYLIVKALDSKSGGLILSANGDFEIKQLISNSSSWFRNQPPWFQVLVVILKSSGWFRVWVVTLKSYELDSKSGSLEFEISSSLELKSRLDFEIKTWFWNQVVVILKSSSRDLKSTIWNSLASYSNHLENIPMNWNHGKTWNITLSDVVVMFCWSGKGKRKERRILVVELIGCQKG